MKKIWRQVVLDLRTKNSHRYHVGDICVLLGVTKQAYYKYDEKKVLQRLAEEEFVIQFVSEARVQAPGLGGKKLWHMYRRDIEGNNPVGRDRFEYILDKYSLKLRKKKRKPRTTDSRHSLYISQYSKNIYTNTGKQTVGK